MKICKNCNNEKPLESFGKRKVEIDKLHYNCKLCENVLNKKRNSTPESKLKRKNYYKNNKEIWKKYYRENIEFKKHQQKVYREKDSTKEKNNQRRKEKRKLYIYYKLSDILRSRLYELLKLKNINKYKSSLILLSCPIQEFRLYIESQFLPEMNWENHGTIWEIDHIKPCSKFDLTDQEQQKQCFHYTNFQPLFKTTKIAESFGYIDYVGNREKGNKI